MAKTGGGTCKIIFCVSGKYPTEREVRKIIHSKSAVPKTGGDMFSRKPRRVMSYTSIVL